MTSEIVYNTALYNLFVSVYQDFGGHGENEVGILPSVIMIYDHSDVADYRTAFSSSEFKALPAEFLIDKKIASKLNEIDNEKPLKTFTSLYKRLERIIRYDIDGPHVDAYLSNDKHLKDALAIMFMGRRLCYMTPFGNDYYGYLRVENEDLVILKPPKCDKIVITPELLDAASPDETIAAFKLFLYFLTIIFFKALMGRKT